MTNRIQIGIDAGGSKVEAVGCFQEASFSSSYPSVNARIAPENETIERIGAVIETVVSSLVQDTEADWQNVDICLGIAGAASLRIQDTLREGISRQSGIPASNIAVLSDARIGFEAAFLNEPTGGSAGTGRMLVICGTGSGCYSFDHNGHLSRTGGWGPTIGDPGSGTELGKRLLRQAMSDIEAGLVTPFTLSLETVFDDEYSSSSFSVPLLLDKVYQSGFNVATLAPVLLNLAVDSHVARGHLEAECASLSEQIVRLARVLKTKSPTVKLTGGLNANSLFSEVLSKAITSCLPESSVRVSKHKPVQGALFLAKTIR